jgi:hypothetical protein
MQQPGTKRFTLQDIQRCSVILTDAAKQYINASHFQGRLLPQALQEQFGRIEQVSGVFVDVAPMREHHRHHKDENATVMLVTVKCHEYTNFNDVVFHLNAEGHLRGLHYYTQLPTVQARFLAMQLAQKWRWKWNRR